jgi:hypothetical protein
MVSPVPLVTDCPGFFKKNKVNILALISEISFWRDVNGILHSVKIPWNRLGTVSVIPRPVELSIPKLRTERNTAEISNIQNN